MQPRVGGRAAHITVSALAKWTNEEGFRLVEGDDPVGVPIPSIMMLQIQCVRRTEILRPLSRTVLHQLQTQILANN